MSEVLVTIVVKERKKKDYVSFHQDFFQYGISGFPKLHPFQSLFTRKFSDSKQPSVGEKGKYANWVSTHQIQKPKNEKSSKRKSRNPPRIQSQNPQNHPYMFFFLHFIEMTCASRKTTVIAIKLRKHEFQKFV